MAVQVSELDLTERAGKPPRSAGHRRSTAHARRRSLARRLVPIGVLLALAGGLAGFLATAQQSPQPVASKDVPPATWFAPYVDVTTTPGYEFQAPNLNPARQVVLGFVVADRAAPCTPSWGGDYTLDQAGLELDLDRRIRQFQDDGGDAIASFGGSSGTELADSCDSLTGLEAAYSAVIGRYHLDSIDLDLEGSALGDSAAITLRSRALAALQHAEAARHGTLAIWLTLPCEPAGMQADALAVVQSALVAGVHIAGVNVLAMDFGTPSDSSPEMGLSVEAALASVHAQLEVAYAHAGIELTSRQAWEKLGATVMIGANDIPGETVSVGDASAITSYATKVGLGRLSMWSLNRDAPCAKLTPTYDCSGTGAKALEFAAVFARLPGVAGAPRSTSVAAPPAAERIALPYPRWRAGETYQAGYKVVWAGYVYRAKWFTGTVIPGETVAHPWLTPWLLLGPVLPGDQSPTTTTLPPGTYPQWSSMTVYRKGYRVLYQGLPYIAAYYSKGDTPNPEPIDVSSAPWRPLFSLPGEPPVSSTG
jgi:chitinase